MPMTLITAARQNLREHAVRRDDAQGLPQRHTLGILESVHAAVELARVVQRAPQVVDRLESPDAGPTRPLVVLA
eukprot:10521222-Heterocapsa_arctica.AAC.1